MSVCVTTAHSDSGGIVDNPEAAFMGRMTAGTTHELRNVLAVVKESAGLIEDLVAASRQRGPLSPEKLLQATRRIDAQVGRGAELLTSLNRVAHGLDQPSEQLELRTHAGHVVALYQRFAHQRRIRLALAPAGAERWIEASALALQMAIGAALDCSLGQVPDGSMVDVDVGGTTEHPALTVRGVPAVSPPPPPTSAAAWGLLAERARAVGALAEAIEGSHGVQLTFGAIGI